MGLHSPIFCDRIPTVLAVSHVEDLFYRILCVNLLILSVCGLRNKPQSLQLPGMFYTGGDEVDTGGLNTGVPQYIRQLCYIPAGAVERTGK